MIEVEGLTKYYGSQAAIRDLSFQIAKGEVIGFLGLNGAGKTTTLRVLGCVLLPTSGHVTIDGHDVVREPHEIRKRIGFLPDVPPLYAEMRVDGYLEFVGQLRGMTREQLHKRVPEVAEEMGLASVRSATIGELSHGYRQRVGLAQAVIHRPALLILDEPTSGLDPAQIVEMRELIASLKGNHTILVSSHNLPEISQTCDRLLLIKDGEIIEQGTEAELASRSGTASVVLIDIVTENNLKKADEAVAALKQVEGVDAVTSSQKGSAVARLRIECKTELRPKLLRALVAADIDVLIVETSTADLENIFLKLTGPKQGEAKS